jgi:hypothetical protein
MDAVVGCTVVLLALDWNLMQGALSVLLSIGLGYGNFDLWSGQKDGTVKDQTGMDGLPSKSDG